MVYTCLDCNSYSSKTYNLIKNKVQQGTCHPSTNSGYVNKRFRIDHKVNKFTENSVICFVYVGKVVPFYHLCLGNRTTDFP